MSEQVVRAIAALEKSINNANREQTKVLAEMMAPLHKLADITQTQSKQTMEAIYDGVKTQVLVAIAQQRGQLGARESQIREELQEVDRLRAAAEKQAEALSANLTRQLEDVSDNAQKLVDQMDRQVLDLGRRVFTESVFLPYTEEVVPHWRLQVGAGRGSQEVRRLAFEQEYRGIKQRVGKYLDEVEQLQKTARDLALEGELPDEINVPVCLVTFEDQGGIKEEMYVAPMLDTDEMTIRSGMEWLRKAIAGKFASSKRFLLDQMVKAYQASKPAKAETEEG